MQAKIALLSSRWRSDPSIVQMRTLLGQVGVYALSSLASPLVSLVLAPFLTHTLSREAYGALAVLLTLIALAAGITQLGLGSAFFRTYSYDYELPSDRLKVISTTILLLLLGTLPLLILFFFAAPWFANILLGNITYAEAIRCATLVILLQNLTLPGLSWLRAENRAKFYSAVSISTLLVTLGATLLLVGLLQLGLVGALLANALGSAFTVLSTLPFLLRRTGLLIRMDIAKNLLGFGLPLIANFVSVWILQLSDRYLLSRFGSLAETGSYAVAYTLGSVLSVVILSPFSLAWPSTMFTLAKRNDAPLLFRLVFRWFSLILLLAAFALSLLSTLLLQLFFPVSYRAAAPVIPLISLSILFYGLYTLMNVGVSLKRKTWFAVIFTTSAALINIGLNLLLIPRYGAMGAASSTLLAYGLLLLIAYQVNQRLYPVPFEINAFLLKLVIGIALYIGSSLLAQNQRPLLAITIQATTCLLYAGLLLILTLSPVKQRRIHVREQTYP